MKARIGVFLLAAGLLSAGWAAAPAQIDLTADTGGTAVDSGQVGRITGGIAIKVETHGEMVKMFDDASLAAGDTCKEMVVIGGNAVVNGHVETDLVVVMGTLDLKGTVGHDVVVVGGKADIAESARIDGELTTVAVETNLDSLAVVKGGRIMVAKWLGPGMAGVRKYVSECVAKGRPFALSVPWSLVVLAGLVALGILLAALFGGPFNRGVEIADRKILPALLTGLLTPLALGPVLLSLVVIVIGIPFIPVLLLLLLWAQLLGTTALCAQAGRRIVHGFGGKEELPVLVSALIGAVLCGALCLVPYAGGLVAVFVSTLGLGVGVYTIVEMMRQSGRNGKGPRKPAGPVAATQQAAQTGTTDGEAQQAAPQEYRLAGFWQRVGAALIDILLVMLLWGITLKPMFSLFGVGGHDPAGPGKLLLLLVYLAVMWAWKQTTVGGVVFKTRLRRLDGAPVTTGVAIVRALGLLLSVMPLGLGFLWIAWDEQRQGWHDKIAGTVVDSVPKGISLV